MTQEMVRDGYVPTSVQLLYFGDLEIFHDKLHPRTSRSAYVPFVWCCVVELNPVKSLLLFFTRPILPSYYFPMAPKRQFREVGGSAGASGVSLVKGNSVKR